MSFMLSEPKHPMWPYLHVALKERSVLTVLDSTGPLIVTDVLSALPSEVQQGIVLAPPDVAFPLDQWQTYTHTHRICGRHDETLLGKHRTKRTIAVEHWCGSWLGQEED